MASSLFFPLDQIKPSQVLSQYSEWIYFTLILVFFISVSGMTLKRHFSKPYVKPVIVTVGLMLTFGVFRFKHVLAAIFEGWGIVGSIILVFVVAIIPYGLCRGFGLSGSKAFYLTYILFYIISWIQFPQIYFILGDRNMGLVNLGLLILFIAALFKVIKFPKSSSLTSSDSSGTGAFSSEIDREIDIDEEEKGVIKKQTKKLTKFEIRTADEMAESLAEVQKIVETHRNNLSREDRQSIGRILTEILRKEDIFKKAIHNIRNIFKRIGSADVNQIKEQKNRLSKVEGKERQILKAEIGVEEKKLKIEKEVVRLEEVLDQNLVTFNKFVKLSAEHIGNSPYPYDAKAFIVKARGVLKRISGILKEIKSFEDELLAFTKLETKLLKKEKETV